MNAQLFSENFRKPAISVSNLKRSVRDATIESSSFSFSAARRYVVEMGQRLARRRGLSWHKKRLPGPIQVVDFFSGCGGMSAGFEALNGVMPSFQICCGVDSDPTSNKSYSANFGVPAIEADIHQLARDFSHLHRKVLSALDRSQPLALIGCSPCQGFSSHRNDKRPDVRNSLFADFIDIACEIEPDAVVIENVPELVTTRHWHFAEYALEALEEKGYFVNLSVHDLARFFVSQHRYRALLIAMKSPFGQISPPSLRRLRTVRDAIGDLPRLKAGSRTASDELHYTASHRPSTVETIRAVPKDGGNRPIDVGPDCLRRAREKQGRGAYDDVYGRLAWDKPAITITAHARNPASGRFSHPDQHRGLSVREAARLQGFPDSFDFAGTLDSRFRQIGNAVPPPFACQIAAHVLSHLLYPTRSIKEHQDGIRAPIANSFARVIPAIKAGYLAPAKPMTGTLR